MRLRLFPWILAIASVWCPTPSTALPRDQVRLVALQNLKGLSIEDLMSIDVTTARRREQPVGNTAAAVSVITRDDIRRMGITTLADALLLADGVAVARFNTGTWAITSRGFNSNAANKLLVMIDGRTEYSPLFTGIFWNTLDYVLDDVDRIEVVRGPGATLWGANAVNGVVNIITRSARDTGGTYVSLTSGNEDPGIVEARYGHASSTGPAWRVYGKFADRSAQKFADRTSAGDAVRRGQSGFRLDGGSASATNWLVTGDLFHSADDLPDRPSGEFTNGSLQARWSRPLAAASRLTVQSYFRHEYRRIPIQLTHHVNTVDLDAQHAVITARHQLVWGGGFRVNMDGTASGTFRFEPPSRTYRVANVFGQDEVAVLPNRLFATIGAKWEHNAFSHGEFQPNVRLRAQLPRNQTAWAAVSRAVRRPTRFEDDLIIPAPNGATLIQGSGDFVAESLVAAEAGYRVRATRGLSFDVAVFHHTIDNLRSQDAPLVGVLPITIGNSLVGHAHGIETAVNVQPLAIWRNHISYTWLRTAIERAAGSRDVSGGVNEADDPRHQVSVRSSLDLARHIEFDVLVRHISQLPNPVVPAFTELSLRLGWSPTTRTEIWLTGQDLLHDQHPEFGPPLPTRVEFERGLRAGVALRF